VANRIRFRQFVVLQPGLASFETKTLAFIINFGVVSDSSFRAVRIEGNAAVACLLARYADSGRTIQPAWRIARAAVRCIFLHPHLAPHDGSFSFAL